MAGKLDFGPEDDLEEEEQQEPIKFEQSVTPVEVEVKEQSEADNLTHALPEIEPQQDKSLTDWSIRTIPDPPSGFKDSEATPPPLPSSDPPPFVEAIEAAEVDDMNRDSNMTPTFRGPMKFSINSYTERSSREEPYPVKISRTESLTASDASFLKPGSSKTLPTLNKAESFNVTSSSSSSRLNGSITGKKCVFVNKLANFSNESISESKPLPPPKPQRPLSEERPRIMVERSKTFVGSTGNVHKTSLQVHMKLFKIHSFVTKPRRFGCAAIALLLIA